MNRTEAIIILEGFKDNPLFNSTHAQALEMAIASLKTDEAYQLEYENRDFVEIPEGMRNWEVMNFVLQKVFPNTTFIRMSDECNKTRSIVYSIKWEDAPYQKGGE